MADQLPPDVQHDVIVIVPAGVAIAICTALIWWVRSRSSRHNPPADEYPPRQGGRNDLP